MARGLVLKILIDTIEKIVQNKRQECFSGILMLHVELVFSDGGIRSCECDQHLKNKIYPTRKSDPQRPQ